MNDDLCRVSPIYETVHLSSEFLQTVGKSHEELHHVHALDFAEGSLQEFTFHKPVDLVLSKAGRLRPEHDAGWVGRVIPENRRARVV